MKYRNLFKEELRGVVESCEEKRITSKSSQGENVTGPGAERGVQGIWAQSLRRHLHNPESEHLLKYGTLGALSPHSLA